MAQKEQMGKGLKSDAVSERESVLLSRVNERIGRSLDAKHAIKVISEATQGDYLIAGGTIRHALFDDHLSGDMDIIIPNDNVRTYQRLDSLKIQFTYNSNKHRRYKWGSIQIDIFRPREFFGGFPDARTVLEHFDLKINAIGVNLSTNEIVDPFGVLKEKQITDPGVNWKRWRRMDSYQTAVLAIRLVKVLTELEFLEVNEKDRGLLVDKMLPKILSADWSQLKDRFPLGKEEFTKIFLKTLSRSERPLNESIGTTHI